MLFVLFQVAKDHYTLPASQIIEVLPLVNLKRIPRVPVGVAGLFNYRGTPVPVIDLNEMMVGVPAARRLSTRIILIKYPLDSERQHPLGLIAENATRALQRSSQDFSEPGVKSEAAPYLGRVAKDNDGLVQWVEVEKLLKPEIRELLFREPVQS